MEKIENGSGRPTITIRIPLDKVVADFDKEIVIFVAKQRKHKSEKNTQTTLDSFIEPSEDSSSDLYNNTTYTTGAIDWIPQVDEVIK